MGDETLAWPHASSSLLEHCAHLGAMHDPKQFGASVPGGVWGDLSERQRGTSPDCGVPIFRVEHKMDAEGMIFTPQDDSGISALATSIGARAVPAGARQAPPEVPGASASLLEHCKFLGAKHDPSQFATSIPGGCWGSTSPMREPSGDLDEACGVPIFRAEHKMNADGMIFTPQQGSDLAQFIVGSVGSDFDSEAGSFQDHSWNSPVLLPDKNAFLASAAAAVAAATAQQQRPPAQPLASPPDEEQCPSIAECPSTPPSGPHSPSSSGQHSPLEPGSPAHSANFPGERSLRPQWVEDHAQDGCASCHKKFGLFLRRHHCRACGHIFCGRCSQGTAVMPHLGYDAAVRVCDNCHKATGSMGPADGDLHSSGTSDISQS